jgi:hypothetical protein
VVSDTPDGSPVTTRTPQHTTGRRARPPSPSGVSSSYPGLPPFQPARPKSGASQAQFGGSPPTPRKARTPAFIGLCGPWRDPDSNRGHHDFSVVRSSSRTRRKCQETSGFLPVALGSRNPADSILSVVVREMDGSSSPVGGRCFPAPGRWPRRTRGLRSETGSSPGAIPASLDVSWRPYAARDAEIRLSDPVARQLRTRRAQAPPLSAPPVLSRPAQLLSPRHLATSSALTGRWDGRSTAPPATGGTGARLGVVPEEVVHPGLLGG